jgi:hypothetical protein
VYEEARIAVGIATGYRFNEGGVEFKSWQYQEFSLLRVIQTGSGVHPASYPMDTRGYFPKGNAARA